jgi:hypothetical protein
MADERIEVSRIIHTIHATMDIHRCRLLYQDALGGLVFAENYFPAEDRDAALLYVTNHMIEPMAPRDPNNLKMPFARMVGRIGQAFHSFELKVRSGRAASQALREAGHAVASDYGTFFFVKPESTGGVLLEVCETPMPNDPYDRKGWGPDIGAGHACSILRLDHIACVTANMAAVLSFFTQLVDGRMLSDERWTLPQPSRRVLIRIGDTPVAFIQPDDPTSGPLGAFLSKPQSGIYSLVWQIAVETQARTHFEDRLKLRLTHEACISPGFAIHPDDFFGARHEFVVG